MLSVSRREPESDKTYPGFRVKVRPVHESEGIESYKFDFVVICNGVFSGLDHVITAAFDGGPVALAYRKFDEQTKEIVQQDYLDSISVFKSGDGYEIPGEFVVTKGVKPEN
jgi:hypothetical protein